MELAGCNVFIGPMWMPVDIKTAHSANTFATVVIKHYRIFSFVDELFVENVEHFEKRTSL
jgi:hypothetical protein